MDESFLPMAENGSQPSLAVKPMGLQIPEPRFQPIIPAERDGLSPEGRDAEDGQEVPEEDARWVVGFSISKTQTRLTSHCTPAAEKAAAMAASDGGGLLGGKAEDREGAQDDEAAQQDLPSRSEGDGTEPSTPTSRLHTATLPTPWRATPKTFERMRTDQQSRQMLESTSIFPEINVRRYLSNLNLPSLPKTPTFKDFSVPVFSTFLNNTRAYSPLRKDPSRPKRASTYIEPGSNFTWGSQFERCPTDNGRRGRDVKSTAKSNSVQYAANVLSKKNLDNRGHQRAISDGSVTPTQYQRLRRTTSDQSLLLRRTTSTGSSLGDDSRWEHVQEQVNSRMKAIKDSLQDSNIRLPNMPNLSSINLGSFRPEFTRSRAPSEAKTPLHATNGLRNHDIPAALTHAASETSSMDVQKSPNFEAFQPKRKVSKASPSYFESALEHMTGDIVIIGGYRGSILRSAQPPHRQLWVPVKVGLNIRRVNLEVGLQPEDEENMENHIFASGMLSHIGPVDMGRRLLKRLRACNNVQEGRLRVHDYGYDWRLSPHLLSRRLITFLEKLKCNAPGVPGSEKGATIIAHSMGGLITRHAVNQRPELFAGAVYAGTPQHCVNILGPLRNGDEVLLSSKVLTAQVNFTLRSSFLLLPEEGKCFINKDTKEEYPVDFFDVEQWKKYAWSPCISPALPPLNPPETKGLFGSVSDMLPSLPSLPLPGKKQSVSQSTKVNDLADFTTTRALDPQTSSPSHSANNNRPHGTIPLPDATAYLDRTLKEILAFKSELTHNQSYTTYNRYPPFAVLYANNTPTVVAARVSSREAIRHMDAYDDLQFASGDGVCLARAAMLPEGYECAKGGRVRTERGHVGLLGDLEALGKCLLAVIRARRHGVGLGLEREKVLHVTS